ncbi:site-specific integrase [Aetokthonos hydrillicola Thurmond2011]|uniref:Site-specific integrase n=1 Tax=Aetokthonos hydrillicola Thurmond2011 TaxID=2712845 RepID=A0AAP5IGT7_9CYAN|nr:site-specific integrase [Aetokthonos hydrillicola]MBW4591138.1 site-specific integrase [Aetokthonos hydrillicola CCALA 1050]MDR9900907.1 site-specific integrase [Aetokthonos hydrillicola Thurmond2011]
MKINRHGKAKILTQSEIQLVFASGLHNQRDKTLFGVCLFSAARIREACTLLTKDIYTSNGQVRPQLIIRKANTKGKLATRSIPVIDDLRRILNEYYSQTGDMYLFPGRSDGHISEDSAARILRQACKAVGIIGVSTHSFRRTALTQMSNAGIPLRVIQEISGHRNLDQLQRYLEVTEEQVLGAASSLAMLSPVFEGDVGIRKYDDIGVKQAPGKGIERTT